MADADLDEGLESPECRLTGEDFVDVKEGGAGRCWSCGGGSSTNTTTSFELSVALGLGGGCWGGAVDGRST